MDSDKNGTYLASSSAHRDSGDEHAHYLVVIQGTGQGRTLELGERPTTIGRHEGNDLCLADPCISKQHCAIRCSRGMVWVSDLGSTNGTYLDEQRVVGKAIWPEGAVLRIGGHELRHEFRSRQVLEASQSLANDLKKAQTYVESLLPAPLTEGPVRVDWRFVPSAVLGGDSFGYYWLDSGRFVFYLIDVCGHGVGPAMHTVTVLNLLRRRSLTGVDFGEPAEVLGALNAALPMEEHGEMFFSIWYGVYHTDNRILTYASGGHPPALLFPPGGAAPVELHVANLLVGVMDGMEFNQGSYTLPAGGSVCLFSDGVFEISLPDGSEWGQGEFRDWLAQEAQADGWSADGIHRKVSALARNGRLDDDFSLMILRFD